MFLTSCAFISTIQANIRKTCIQRPSEIPFQSGIGHALRMGLINSNENRRNHWRLK
jgi:hypothetical protein